MQKYRAIRTSKAGQRGSASFHEDLPFRAPRKHWNLRLTYRPGPNASFSQESPSRSSLDGARHLSPASVLCVGLRRRSWWESRDDTDVQRISYVIPSQADDVLYDSEIAKE